MHELNLPAHYFLYVGRLVEQKGIFHLLEAYEKMTSQIRGQVGLVFVGDGPDRSRLLQRAAAIALLQSWLENERTDDPEEIRKAEEELEEFKRNMNANRAATGERLLFP